MTLKCAWYRPRFVLWAGIATICIGVIVELARERMEHPLFANVYAVSDHSFFPWPRWVMQPPVDDKNGVVVYADFDRNVVVVIGKGIPNGLDSLVASSSQVATFMIDEKKGAFIEICCRPNELIVIDGEDEYTALVIKAGQARIIYDLVDNNHRRPLSDVLADSASVQKEVKNFLIRTLHHVGSRQME